MPSICLDIPPSVNHYWVRTRNGGLRVSDRGIEYRNHVAVTLNREGIGRIEPPARVCVWIKAFFGDARKRDLDNLTKSVLDAFTKAGAWEDDEQIDDLRVTRHPIDRAYPRIEVYWSVIGVCE